MPQESGLPHAHEDAPAPIDFRVPEEAREWTASAMTRRPYRVEVFRAITGELAGRHEVLELGSGPGFLAEAVLNTGWTGSYTALDFSDAMHALARERLGASSDRVQFVTRDFKQPNWTAGLDYYDAVITMQAVHEVRHKRHIPAFYKAVQTLLRPAGIFLMCDIFAGEGGNDDTTVFMTPGELESALQRVFTDVRLVLKTGALVLFRATR